MLIVMLLACRSCSCSMSYANRYSTSPAPRNRILSYPSFADRYSSASASVSPVLTTTSRFGGTRTASVATSVDANQFHLSHSNRQRQHRASSSSSAGQQRGRSTSSTSSGSSTSMITHDRKGSASSSAAATRKRRQIQARALKAALSSSGPFDANTITAAQVVGIMDQASASLPVAQSFRKKQSASRREIGWSSKEMKRSMDRAVTAVGDEILVDMEVLMGMGRAR